MDGGSVEPRRSLNSPPFPTCVNVILHVLQLLTINGPVEHLLTRNHFNQSIHSLSKLAMAALNDVPVYHYFELGRLGRGEVVKLFLKDAGIEIKEVRYPYNETWAENGKKLQQQGLTRTRKLPALEYKDMNLTQHIPTLRFFARELGRYDGETNAEKFLVDAVSDIYIDWRVSIYHLNPCPTLISSAGPMGCQSDGEIGKVQE